MQRNDIEDLAARARAILGMRRREFLETTPEELARIFDAHQERDLTLQELEDKRFARLFALLANRWRDEKKRSSPFSEDDFMPSIYEDRRERKRDEAEKRRRRASMEETINLWIAHAQRINRQHLD